jgi:two-component system chemotaxis sensor kinase CheA
MSLRMTPVGPIFDRMKRLVRDLALRMNKEVELQLEGSETEFDRTMVEDLADPLLHMVRNALDHGLEPPAERLAAGKPARGCLRLRARHQHGSVVIELSDDGRGLAEEKLIAKAVARGMITPETRLSRAEAYQLIFASGFSTAKEVTEVSGRGVGMDVVRRNLEKMQGRVEIDSEPGAGTTFRIFLPLTMAIIDGLLVRIGAGQYVIPTLAVRESLRPAADAVIENGWGNGQLQHRGQSYPVLGLPHFLGLPKAKRSVRQTVVVLVEAGCAVFGLLVDELLGKQEIVIKTLEEPLDRNPVFAGAAILGDGRVGLILEPRQLLEPAKIVAARVVAAAKSGTRPETSPAPKLKRNEEELAAL